MSSRNQVPRGFYPGQKKDAAGKVVPMRAPQPSTIALSPGARLKELLNRSDAKALVRGTPTLDLFLMVKQLGLPDAVPVLELASGEQIQRMEDLDIWQKDELDEERYLPWLEAVLESREQLIPTLFDAMDPEPLVHWLKRYVTVYVADDERSEDERHALEALEPVAAPDGFFLLVIEPDCPYNDFILALVQRLYAEEMKVGQWLLQCVRWELSSNLEETAYRLRQGRVEELGMVDYTEALAMFQKLRSLDPLPRGRQQSSGAGPMREMPLPESLIRPEVGSFFARAMAQLTDDGAIETLARQILMLAQKVMVVERLDPGELDDLTLALRMVRAHVGLGLELHAAGDVSRGAVALQQVHLQWLFQRGLTEVLELQGIARGLSARLRPAWRRLPGPLLTGRAQQLIEGLSALRPVNAWSKGGQHPAYFGSVQEVQEARLAVEAIQAQVSFVFSFLAPGPVEVRRLTKSVKLLGIPFSAESVFLTSVCRSVVGGGFCPEPLTPAELQQVLSQAFEPTTESGRIRAYQEAFVARVREGAVLYRTGGGAHADAIDGFVTHCLNAFRDAYGAVRDAEGIRSGLLGGPVFLLDT